MKTIFSGLKSCYCMSRNPSFLSGLPAENQPLRNRKAIILLLFAVILSAAFPAGAVAADPMGALLEQYEERFEAVVPEPYSSINSDYRFDQIAMGSMYTTKALGLLHAQNLEIIRQQSEMIRKYDKLIEQNEELIRLLKRMAGAPAPPGMPE